MCFSHLQTSRNHIQAEAVVFSSEWKKSNIVPIHKKETKKPKKLPSSVVVTYLHVKGLERFIFNKMFKSFIENKRISSNQSGFKPGNAFINQLLSTTHEIYESFDMWLEVRSVFLDISKAFDKVWHDDIIFKQNQNEISGNLLNLLQVFLKERKQSVVLNGQVSTWKNINAGYLRVPSLVLYCF